MGETKDWYRWHESYADPSSPLSRRASIVREHLVGWLDEHPDAALRLVSICAGQGRDVLDVLTTRADAGRVQCHLLDTDERNVAVAQAAVNASGLTTVTIHRSDAGDLASYTGIVPADLVLLAGIFGNITDADVQRTIETLPQLCAAGATVIWTRHRRPPDLTPAIREWLQATGFTETAFHAPGDVLFSVGVDTFTGQPEPLRLGRMFRFTD
jgi:putative methyltransferase